MDLIGKQKQKVNESTLDMKNLYLTLAELVEK